MKKLTLIYLFISTLSALSQGNLYHFQENKKTGYIDSLGDIVIHAQFDHGNHFSEGLAAVHWDGKVGYIDLKGNVVITAKFDHGFLFREGVAIVKVNSLYGLINRQGRYILKPIYQYIHFQNEGKIGVKQDNLWGFYTITGKKITGIKYKSIGEFSEGLAMVQSVDSHKFGFINSNGKMHIPFVLTQVYSTFHNGYASVDDSLRRRCFIDLHGKNTFGMFYFNASGFSEGKAFVKTTYDSLGYFINTNGKRIFDHSFRNVWDFNDGFCGALMDSTYVIIDTVGNIIFSSPTIELRYYNGDFGLFCDHSGVNLTWGIMNRKQEIVSNQRFTLILSLPGGQFVETYFGDPAKWYGHGKRGYVDIKGNYLWQEK